ncbi:MAG: helix-turn-helix domain-containing protein [Hyphomicrobiaceae bacterium]
MNTGPKLPAYGEGPVSRIDVHVGKRVATRRMELLPTEDHVATHIGLSVRELRRYESGVQRIGAATLIRLSKFLDLTMAEIFCGLDGETTASDEPTSAKVIVFPSARCRPQPPEELVPTGIW